MRQGIQTLMSEAGESACYALCIIEIAERISKKSFDVISSILAGISNGFIKYNFHDHTDPDNFYVLDPSKFLYFLVGTRWEVRKESATYIKRGNEYEVDVWEYKPAGKVVYHFRLPDWDSLEDSNTVKYGKVVSKRIYKRIG